MDLSESNLVLVSLLRPKADQNRSGHCVYFVVYVAEGAVDFSGSGFAGFEAANLDSAGHQFAVAVAAAAPEIGAIAEKDSRAFVSVASTFYDLIVAADVAVVAAVDVAVPVAVVATASSVVVFAVDVADATDLSFLIPPARPGAVLPFGAVSFVPGDFAHILDSVDC